MGEQRGGDVRRPWTRRSAAAARAASILVLFAVLAVSCGQPDGRCLSSYAENSHKAGIYFQDQSHDLTVLVSRRLTSRLTSHIFKIFLEEVMGYRHVRLVIEDANNTTLLIKSLSTTTDGSMQVLTVPNAMISLEVFITPDIDFLGYQNYYDVADCGLLTPMSRFGWFVPKILTERLGEEISSWEYFSHSYNVGPFDLADEELNFIKEYSMDINSKYYCSEPFCIDGMYVPNHCNSSFSPCAIMLAPFVDSTEFIVHHINELKVYIKVVWLGPNLEDVVRSLTERLGASNVSKSVMFLNWSPGYPVIDNMGLTSLLLPTCESMESRLTIGCKYELTKIVKLAWHKLQMIGQPVFQSMHKMQFTREQYGELAKYYKENPSLSDRDIACKWMNDKSHIWSHWKLHYKDNLYIGGIFPLSGVSYNAEGIVIGAHMATEAVNANSSILHDYSLILDVENGQCEADLVMKKFFDFIVDNKYDKFLGVLGPACSETVEPLAGISKHYKTVIISYSAEGSSFSDRTKYPYFFRTIGENKQYKHVYLELLKRLGWKRVAALTEDGQKYSEYISYTEALLQQNGIQFIANAKFPREHDNETLTRFLSELKRKRARVVVADVYEAAARAVVCEALRLKMTAKQGYVWFLPLWLSHRWYNTTHYNQLYNESTDCTLEEMVEAINGHFALTHAPYGSDDQLMQTGSTVGHWRSQYRRRFDSMRNMTRTEVLSDYAGYAYDAVWTYALAVDKLLRETPEALSDLHSDKNTQRLVNIIGNSNFNGVSGNIRFRGGPSRFSVVNIVQWVNYELTTVGSFHPNVSEDRPAILGGKLTLNESAIVWLTPDGRKPDDGSRDPNGCVFQTLADFLNIGCSETIVVVNVFGFALLGLVLLFAFFYIKSKYDKRILLTAKYMKSIGINLSTVDVATLDKWEIPRERVVVNRKLGEGAFGTVYGGEAFFPEGKGWTAVAVKTLKAGSNTEEKLDFLSEAESMKRFDHKNIIKLLGVCTKNDPIYTIMEFMLYGDLKTYLLARRHIVNQKYSEESEEVSSKKLTAMALDVAKALSYLADLKYVHRDVACRNCLVNSHRVVKLADFGMTRLIFENDYYRFSRKGLLPVRWMAPESLGLGIFTPASDVWSYGVLLYEIVTFGSFPFQGLSNNQVLEHVKSGKMLTIPSGVRPQLHDLMKSCWKMEHKARPNASEIVDFIANNPRLLAPRLDAPLASIQVEAERAGRLEMLESKCPLSVSAAPAPPAPPTPPAPSTHLTSELDYGPNRRSLLANNRASRARSSPELQEEVSFL